MEPVVNVWLQTGVNVAIIELAVEDEKDLVVVDERGDDLCFGPFGFCIEFFGEAVPAGFVGEGDFGEVVVQDGLVKVDDELIKKVDQRVISCVDGVLARLTTSGIWAKAVCCAIWACMARRAVSSSWRLAGSS